ncbi:hypothetical protein Tco_0174311 [Tanacetum coccineum]
MSTQQDIYVAGSENHPPMLNKDNYVPWSSRLLCYAKSKWKLLMNSIIHGPYVRRMIYKPGDPNGEPPIAESTHKQTDDELTKNEEKQMKKMIKLFRLYSWMMKESYIGAQEKKDKLFNEWEKFNSTEGESIESYYHRFAKLMNDFSINKHFLEKIASNLKFLNNLQPEWKRHMKHEAVNEVRAERLAKTHDHLALMANAYNPYNYPLLHPDQPSQITYMQHPSPNNNYVLQPSFNTNYMQNPDEITNPTTAMNMALVLMAKAFKLNYSTLTKNNQRILSNPRNRKIAQPGMNMGQDRQMQMVRGKGRNQFRQYAGQNSGNQIGYNVWLIVGNPNRYNAMQNAGNQQALTLGTQTDKALVYDSDESAEQAQKKQQSLYNGRVLLDKHDPPVVYDSDKTLQLAQESRLKMKQLNKEIKPKNYAKINKLSEVFVSQTAKSRKEV